MPRMASFIIAGRGPATARAAAGAKGWAPQSQPGLTAHFRDTLRHRTRCAQPHVPVAQMPGHDSFAVTHVPVIWVRRTARAAAAAPVAGQRRAPGIDGRADSRIEFIQRLSGGCGHALSPLGERGRGRLPGSGELLYRVVVMGHSRIVSPGAACGQRSGHAAAALVAIRPNHISARSALVTGATGGREVRRRHYSDEVHKSLGQRDPAAAFPLAHGRDDASERRQANRAIAVSAVGLGLTGLVELLLALLTNSVGLLGDGIHNLSDVSTSLVVFVGFRLSRRPPTDSYPYGMERAEDVAGIGIAVVIWASAAFAVYESVRKLVEHGHTAHVGAGIAGAALGIIGNQVVARYKLTVGNRINSATLIADARHSWLDALSSAGALAGLIAVAFGQSWGDPVAGLAVTGFICHVGYEVTKDVVHRLADGIDPQVISAAEAAAGSVPGVVHAHARARWTGRTLRVELEAWVDPDLTAREADAMGRLAADVISRQLPAAGSLTWTTRAAP